jgi:hypothetical protein
MQLCGRFGGTLVGIVVLPATGDQVKQSAAKVVLQQMVAPHLSEEDVPRVSGAGGCLALPSVPAVTFPIANHCI